MKQVLDTRTKLLTKSPWPLMIELSIPAVLGMVVVGLYNMMDSIFVGQMVGDVAGRRYCSTAGGICK